MLMAPIKPWGHWWGWWLSGEESWFTGSFVVQDLTEALLQDGDLTPLSHMLSVQTMASCDVLPPSSFALLHKCHVLVLLSLNFLFLLVPFSSSYRMQINSTRASCLSSPPWLPSTLRLRVAATGEAQKTKGTLEGLNPLPRKSCSHAGKKHQTTAPSPPSSGLLIAPAIQGRGTITAGPGLRPQSNLFLFLRVFLKKILYSNIRNNVIHMELLR